MYIYIWLFKALNSPTNPASFIIPGTLFLGEGPQVPWLASLTCRVWCLKGSFLKVRGRIYKSLIPLPKSTICYLSILHNHYFDLSKSIKHENKGWVSLRTLTWHHAHLHTTRRLERMEPMELDVVGENGKYLFLSMVIPGTPNKGVPLMVSFPYWSHIFRDSYGSGMGTVWARGPMIGGPWKSPYWFLEQNQRCQIVGQPAQLLLNHGCWKIGNCS